MTYRLLSHAHAVRAFLYLTVSAMLIAALSGCGSSRGVSAKRASGKSVYVGKGGGAGKTSQRIEVAGSLPDETRRLLEEARRWMGTAYRYGGNSRSGVDCSGLTSQIFVNALQIKLPRSSSQQSEYCRRIDRSELIEGDLVFFRTGSGGVSHVGMYVGDGRIIHSSTSRGVILSSLDEAYYKHTYHSSGRVERYYAMIDGKKGGKRKKPEPAESKPATDLKHRIEESPVSVPAEDLDRLLAGASRKEAVKNVVTATVSAAAGEASEAIASAVQPSGRKPASKESEAVRKALEKKRRVLEEIIDQKVDSVISDYFD